MRITLESDAISHHSDLLRRLTETASLLARLDEGELQDVERMVRARAAYRDDSYPERACDYCARVYRGPAVYCSLRCTQAYVPP